MKMDLFRGRVSDFWGLFGQKRLHIAKRDFGGFL
jgi:hypothetical protein